jgi:hypothetical protein
LASSADFHSLLYHTYSLAADSKSFPQNWWLLAIERKQVKKMKFWGKEMETWEIIDSNSKIRSRKELRKYWGWFLVW